MLHSHTFITVNTIFQFHILLKRCNFQLNFN